MFKFVNGRWVFVPAADGGRLRHGLQPSALDKVVQQAHFCLNTPDGGGSSGSNSNGGDSSTLSAQDIAALKSLIGTTGSQEETLHTLFAENGQLKARLAEAQQNQIPAGALILVGQDLETWKQVRSLDIPLNDLKVKLETIGSLEAKVHRMEREGSLAEVAAITGWNKEVFIALDGLDNTKRSFEIRDADNGGKMVFVKEGEDGAWTDAANYLKTTWPQFVPSLIATGQPAEGETAGTDLQAGGTVVVQQPPATPPVGAPAQNGTQQGTGQQIQGTVYLTQPAGSGQSDATTPDDKEQMLNAATSVLDGIYGRKKKDESQAAA